MNPHGDARVRIALLVLVTAAHVFVLMQWRHLAPAHTRPEAPRPPARVLQVVVLPPLERVAPPPELPKDLEPVSKGAAPTRDKPAPRRAPAAAVFAAPAPDAAPPGDTSVSAPSLSVAPSTAPSGTAADTPRAPAPLDLSLPPSFRASARPASASATNDPRGNTQRLSPEQKMARAFDRTERVEILTDGTRRVRIGDKCTLEHPNIAGSLDPYDKVHNQVRGSEPCP